MFAVAAKDHCPDFPFVTSECADQLAGPSVPDLHDAVSLPRDQVTAIRAERHGVVRSEAVLPRDWELLHSSSGVPDLDDMLREVCAGRGDPLAVRVPGQTEGTDFMGSELEVELAGGRVPELHPRASTGRDNCLAIWAERHSPHVKFVIREGEHVLALVGSKRGGVPDADGSVCAGRGQTPPVRAECHTPALVSVSSQTEHLPAGCIPNAHGLVVAGRGEALTFRVEGDAKHLPGMTESVEERGRIRIPKFHGLVVASRGQLLAVGTDRHCADRMTVCGESVQRVSSCFRIPEPLAFAKGSARNQLPTVTVERDGDRVVFVSGEGAKDFTLPPIPDSHLAVTARDELSALGRTERNGISGPKWIFCIARTTEGPFRRARSVLAGRKVPDLYPPVLAGGGEVVAIRVEHHAARRLVVGLEPVEALPRSAVPDLDGPVRARRGEPFSVGAERHAVNCCLVPDDQRLDLEEPHEVIPFPPAEVVRTRQEYSQGGGQVVHRQLAMGHCDSLKVHLHP